MLRINESLFHLIGHIQRGGGIGEFVDRNPVMNRENILKVLLMLAGGGYLKLEKARACREFPFVSIIVPVRDDLDNIVKCLNAVGKLNYPKDRFEIIVVDDGSREPVFIFGIQIIRNETSKGPAASRNTGAQAARGEIFAFLDADCVAGENWLNETMPFFKAVKIGAVGGYIEGYSQTNSLDRYEDAFSSLNMGRRFMMEAKSGSSFYVPTANMLVSKEAFKATGGFNEEMRIGEDVDFCWRLRDLGYSLVYAPFGTVAHKHRNELTKMLRRKMEYGSSEALLYKKHPDKRKSFGISILPALSFLALIIAAVLLTPFPLIAIPVFYIIDLVVKSRNTKQGVIPLSFRVIAGSALRGFFSFFYYAFYHLIRYYLVPVIALGSLWYPLWILGGLAILWPSLADYFIKKPALNYPVFLFYYVLDQLSYQVGVLAGCIKHRYFGVYILSFKKL